jgi:predicted SAM-dependent methyltransferase
MSGGGPAVATLKSKIGKIVVPLLPFNRRTFNILRHEVRALTTTWKNRVHPTAIRTMSRLKRSSGLSINVGSGGRGLPSWINIELIPMRDTTICLDLRRRLPFADASARRIFSEHVIEHLDFRDDVPLLFSEFYRILQPRGTLRVIVPDAARFLEAYVRRDRDLWLSCDWDIDSLPHDIYTPMHVINHIFHQSGEHLFGYDFDTLRWALNRAGFQAVIQQQFGISVDPGLALDQEVHKLYSLYVDAIK